LVKNWGFKGKNYLFLIDIDKYLRRRPTSVCLHALGWGETAIDVHDLKNAMQKELAKEEKML
jgi:hypothetical protein